MLITSRMELPEPLWVRALSSSRLKAWIAMSLVLFWPVPLSFAEEDAITNRALINTGDVTRLDHALAKARRGQTVTIGFIGGSITQGAKASRPENRYVNLVTDWWRQTFPDAKVDLINAGIGATGSNYGALRVQRDLLAKTPDFVIVEFAANDHPTSACAETMEGLVRQILAGANQPAVLLLFMMNSHGVSAEEWHAKVGRHYNLPMISYRDAVWPEIEARRLQWTDLSPDEVHPNDRGMALAARFVIRFLAQTLQRLPTDERLLPIAPVPPPLFTDKFAHVALFEADRLRPTGNTGWSYDSAVRCWASRLPGSVIEFEMPGRWISLMFFRLKGGMGKAKVQVDDGPPTLLDGWFSGTWGGYRETIPLSLGLLPGSHRVRVELLEETNPQSTGHEFRILGIGAAGVNAP